MSQTTDIVDAMDDNLELPKEEVKETVDEQQDDKPNTEDTSTNDTDEVEEDDGYIIDDEEDEKTTTEDPKPEVKAAPLNTEQQFIYDGLPTLSVLGKDGKQYDIKVPNELPTDFEFANARDAANFNASIASQELKANQLQQQFQNEAATKSAEEFATREDRAITEDIANLQKTGELAKFKKQPSDPDFDSDPTAKTVTEIVDFMNKKNADYLKRNQAGQAYRHIGFEEAFYLYRRENPEKARSAEQQAEDKQRKEVARAGGSKGTPAAAAKRQPIQRGTTTRDLYAMIDGLE